MRPRLALLALTACLGIWPQPTTAAEDDLLRGGDLKAWSDGIPTHWVRSEGARQSGPEKSSSIEALQGGGLVLRGDAKTTRWQMISQRFKARAGDYLELSAAARARGHKREPGQFGSSYVGLLFRDTGGKPNGFQVQDVRHAEWREVKVRARVPTSAATVEAAIFLSMTGSLEVRNVHARTVPASESFKVLVDEMDRQYSYFHANGIDWPAITARHADAAKAAKTPAAFTKVIQGMLAELRDGHIWIDGPNGKRTFTWTPKVKRNFELQHVLGRVQGLQQVIRNVMAGRTKDGFGYLVLGTMQGTPAQLTAVEEAWRGLFDAPGIILDLRVNGGGQELWGQRLAGYLTKKRVLYGRAQRRAGPKHDDFLQAGDRFLIPNKSTQYAGPVVALVGPGCVSSGEGLAMMLKALPGATLVGLPTRGSSGNPMPIALPNGVRVWFSRWVNQLPDGTVTERRGVPPDVRVPHVAGKDPAMDEAVKILKAKSAGR